MSTEIVNKIRKLLELAKSANEHEAANAAARAAELMIKHQVEEADLEAATGNEKPDPIIDEALDVRGRWVSWKGWITIGLADAFGCEAYRVINYVNGVKQDMHRIVGPDSVMPTVRYMYQYLTKEVERLADDGYRIECEALQRSGFGRAAWPSARQWKASFRAGAANKIRARLSAQRRTTIKAAEQAGQTQALAVIDKHREAIVAAAQQIAPWNYNKKGERKYRSGSYSASSSSGWGAGSAAGANVSLGGGKALGEGQRRLK